MHAGLLLVELWVCYNSEYCDAPRLGLGVWRQAPTLQAYESVVSTFRAPGMPNEAAGANHGSYISTQSRCLRACMRDLREIQIVIYHQEVVM